MNNKHKVIFKDQNYYSSFPSIIKTDQNHLILVFRVAGKLSVGAAKINKTTHHDPESKIMIIESFDSGKSWKKDTLRIIYTPPKDCGVNDPALTLLSDNTLILRVAVLNIVNSDDYLKVGKNIISHRPENGLITSLKGNLILKSKDLGKSWSELGYIDKDTIKTCSRDPVIELEDSSIMVSAYSGAPKYTDTCYAFKSFDKGNNWPFSSIIASDKNSLKGQHYGINFNETALLNLNNGKILAIIRCDEYFKENHTNEYIPVGGLGNLKKTFSYDSGLSWLPPSNIGIWGQPPTFIETV